MNALLFTDVQFDSEDAWQNFELIHGVQHQSVYEAIMALDLLPIYTDLFEFPRNSESYLLDHWRVHQSNALLLGIPLAWDLSTADLNDEVQYAEWLAQHAQVHFNENRALGIM